MHKISLFLIVVMFMCSCTQQPAQVMLRGNESFVAGNNNHVSAPARTAKNSYQSQSPAPVETYHSQATSNTAPMQSVSVKELAPPTKTPVAQTAQLKAPTPVVTAAATPAPVVKEGQVAKAQGFIHPVEGKIVSSFGSKVNGSANEGINIAAAEGEPVYATADGEVAFTGNGPKGYGNMVILKHAGNKNSAYSHMSRSNVKKYDRVKQGDIIGYVGSTGNVKAPQLHFAIREGTTPVNPTKYLSSSYAAN